jgi:Flp pilus assembly protein TadD
MAGAAVLLFNIGQTDEAYRLGQQAAQLDPLNAATHIDLSLMFYMNKNWIAAERSARRALELAPGGSSYRGILSWSLIAQGRLEEAEVEIGRETHDIERTNAYGLLAIARGQNDKARARAEQMEEVARSNPDVADLQMSIAWISSLIGDKDRAFTALDRARTTRDPSLAWLRNSFYLQALESDPRWEKLLHQVGLADEQLK